LKDPPVELSPRERDRALGSLVLARACYAYNWYNVGPIQAAIAAGLAVSFGTVSLALTLFLAGVGLFQVPAGILSLRWGARRTSLAGISLMSVAAVGSALAPNFPTFLVARFLVGVGAALFFSPAIGLVARYYRDRGRGVAIGLYNGAFNLGAGVAVFLTSLVASAIGWRESLLLGGALMGAITLENLWVLPHLDEPRLTRAEVRSRTRGILRNRDLWALGLAFLGFWVAEFALAQYYVPWAEGPLGLSPLVAGGMDAVLVMSSVLGGPIGGYLTERLRRPLRAIVLSAVITAAAAAALPFAPVYALWALAAIYGLFTGVVFAGFYLMATWLPEVSPERVPLALGLMNGIQVTSGSAIVLVVGLGVFGPGEFALGFLLLGLVTLLPLPFLVGARGLSRTSRGDRAALPGG
jgi:predicted MFS family arabinose efflux permease